MKKRIFSILAALVMVLTLLPSAVFAADEVADLNALISEAAEDATIKLTKNAKLDGATIAKDVIIDLNGKTLTIDNQNAISGGAEVLFKNGTMDITGATVEANSLFLISGEGTVLSLEKVNLIGDGYSSAFAVFYAPNEGTLNLTDCTVDLKNEQHESGGFAKADTTEPNFHFTNTSIKLTDAGIGFVNSTVAFDTVDLDIVGGGNAINGPILTIANSELTVKDCNGRALTVTNGDVVIENSVLDFSGATEGEIRFKESHEIVADTRTEIKECTIWADEKAEEAAINGNTVTGTEEEPTKVEISEGTTKVDGEVTECVLHPYKTEWVREGDVMARYCVDCHARFTTGLTAGEKVKDNIRGLMMWLRTQKFDVTVKASEGGTVSFEGKKSFRYYDDVEITVKADEGYEIDTIKVDGEVQYGKKSTVKIKNIKADHKIEVTFKAIPVTLPAIAEDAAE